MKQRKWTKKVAALFVVGIAAAACGDDDGTSAASTTNSTSIPTTAAPSTTSTTSTTSASSSTTTRSAAPAAVAVVSAAPGGGSGEITLRWNAVANATGYRVLRANVAGGPFTVSADINLTTGKATAASDVTNVWSPQHSYVPAGANATVPDSSPSFQYVEVPTGGVVQRHLRVVAYNANGDAPASVVVCGAPPGRPSC